MVVPCRDHHLLCRAHLATAEPQSGLLSSAPKLQFQSCIKMYTGLPLKELEVGAAARETGVE